MFLLTPLIHIACAECGAPSRHVKKSVVAGRDPVSNRLRACWMTELNVTTTVLVA
jgi:ribosomal protein L37E